VRREGSGGGGGGGGGGARTECRMPTYYKPRLRGLGAEGGRGSGGRNSEARVGSGGERDRRTKERECANSHCPIRTVWLATRRDAQEKEPTRTLLTGVSHPPLSAVPAETALLAC